MNILHAILFVTFRTIRWLWIKITAHNGEIIRDVMGSQMVLRVTKPGLDLKEDDVYKQLALDGEREFEATKIIQSIIKPGDVIFELGANIGYYALLESRLTGPEGIIYAVEPESSNIETLKRNIALNAMTNITVEEMAISDQEGSFPLYVSPSANLHSMVRPTTGNYQMKMVKTTTVDRYLADKRPIDYLRMDIEGYEFQAIKGMEQTLRNRSGLRLFIELHAHILQPEQTIEILQFLKSHRYAIMAAITHDNALRRVLGHVTVEHPTIDELCEDPRVRARRNAFEIFFTKT